MIVYSGIGAITPFFQNSAEAFSLLDRGFISDADAQKFRLTHFNAAPFLSQKRMMKSVSWYQAIGLAALENCKKDSLLETDSFSADDVGVFVGASAPSCHDNSNYLDSIEKSKQADGSFSEQIFGEQCMSSLGTTLLLGLTNNVLCYGAMVLNARGPNSNYMCGEISGHMAIATAVNNIREKRLKCAVAGSYAMNSDEIFMSIAAERKHLQVYPTDCGIFLTLEEDSSAKARMAPILAEHISESFSNVGSLRFLLGPDVSENDIETVVYVVESCLRKAKLSSDQVGLVFHSNSGISYIDDAEREGLARVFGEKEDQPPFASIAKVYGNFMEASGLLEISLNKDFYEKGYLPRQICTNSSFNLNQQKPYTLILKGSTNGDYSCLCIKNFAPA